MNLLATLQITQKGLDEVRLRAYKLGMKKRSVLILLEKPQTIESIIRRSVIPEAEIVAEIRALIVEAFVTASDGARPAAAPRPSPVTCPPLRPDISIAEGKFLLVDFCVDHFGTGAEALVEEIRACRDDAALDACLAKAFAATRQRCPAQVPTLLALIDAINATA